MRKIVFISGPITASSAVKTAENLYAFEEAEYMLLKAGYAPINPASDWDAVKHGGLDRKDLLEKDEALVAVSAALYQLDGWRDAPGARQEARWAEKYGKPCAWTLTRLHKVLED